MKKILGLDLGTNSIGWALIEQNHAQKEGRILGTGSRIIPMDQKTLTDYESGNSVSQTAERTRLRTVRRLRERQLQRRNRLHLALHILGFLPDHYKSQIDFYQHPGKFLNDSEPLLPYLKDNNGKSIFIFRKSFLEMLEEFNRLHPELINNGKKVPSDWTLYYLREKALSKKIEKDELAWIILNFNQKRGYFQLRDEKEEELTPTVQVEYVKMKVLDVQDTGEEKKKDEKWYKITLENGWSFNRPSKTPPDWIGKTKEFIVTTSLNEDGTVKVTKDGSEKRSFRVPDENDWNLIKKKTEHTIAESGRTVGTYIFENLLLNPGQKIRGRLVRTIERDFYKDELRQILEKQAEFHEELQNGVLLEECLNQLYVSNKDHRDSVAKKGWINLFLNDIIFYQRPLKSKKSQISDCRYEYRTFIDHEGTQQVKPIKCIPKSHPLYIEFRLWQFIRNLRILRKEDDQDYTDHLLPDAESRIKLYRWLNDKKEIDQKTFFSFPLFPKKSFLIFRWNYVEDKIYPMNPTRHLILSKLKTAEIQLIPDQEFEVRLWHLLYSVTDKAELIKGLTKFSQKHSLPIHFAEALTGVPRFKNEYGAYSEKAVKKLLSLMREGEYYDIQQIEPGTVKIIRAIQERLLAVDYQPSRLEEVADGDIPLRLLKSFLPLKNPFMGLNTYQACYAVYGRHSEDGDLRKWDNPLEIERFLKEEFKQYSLRNPIAEQIISETLKVVRDIWIEFGQGQKNFFDEIHIELGRELKNTKEERMKISRINNENELANQRARLLLSELSRDPECQNVRPESPNQLEILKIFEDGVLNAEKELPEDIEKILRNKQPSSSEIIRYKLWLEQKYRSPYTGQIIPLSKLFTADYQIEHIIPQARYFDDSFNNKVICEAEVNADKKAMTGYEYIKNNSGKSLELGFGKRVRLFTLEEYEDFIKRNYVINKGKRKRLLSEDIPEEFVERQLNDTRYISRYVRNLLSSIVREEGEAEMISKNILTCTGPVTSSLKRDWNLDEVWNEIITPRFRRLNSLTGSNMFGDDVNRDGKRFFRIDVPEIARKGFSKKRIDHRHHAMDALVIACATKDHVNFINNVNAKTENFRYDLRGKICMKLYKNGERYDWVFTKPWESFTADARSAIEGTIASIKQNLRVINKTSNWYQKWQIEENGTKKKMYVKQVKGENWAIRKSLHKDTCAGQISIREKKKVLLSKAITTPDSIVDKDLRSIVRSYIKKGLSKDGILNEFKRNKCILNGKDVSRVDIWEFTSDTFAVRRAINPDFKINEVTDSGIRKILLRHLADYNEEKDGKIIEHPEFAFSIDGLDKMNKNIKVLNDGVPHKPIYKARLSEHSENKFQVGLKGNKKRKFVEADKGTNLYFGIYVNPDGKRSYQSVPLNLVIENLKNDYPPVPERNEVGHELLFYLSPDDIVYVPDGSSPTPDKFYRMISSTDKSCYFRNVNVAGIILKKIEFESMDKMEKTTDPDKTVIKEKCIKVKVDRLGRIKFPSSFSTFPLITRMHDQKDTLLR